MKDRLKLLRKTLDLTQQEFAEALGIKRNTIATYEIGRNEPIDAVVQLICNKYNVNEQWLRTGEGEMFIKLDPDLELMQWAGRTLANRESFQYRFISMLSKLSEDEWEWIAQKAQEIADCKVIDCDDDEYKEDQE